MKYKCWFADDRPEDAREYDSERGYQPDAAVEHFVREWEEENCDYGIGYYGNHAEVCFQREPGDVLKYTVSGETTRTYSARLIAVTPDLLRVCRLPLSGDQ